MTLIDIHQTVPDGEVGNPEAPAKGYQTWTPKGPGARRRAEDPGREVREAGFRVDLLPAGVTTVEVAPTDGTWVWVVREYVEKAEKLVFSGLRTIIGTVIPPFFNEIPSSAKATPK